MAVKNGLTVQLKSSSYHLGETNPIEIRDSRLSLVTRLHRGQSVELDDGLYEISAVLEDGQKYRRLVHLHGGGQEAITLEAQEARLVVGPSSPLEKKTSTPLAESDYIPIRVFTASGSSDMDMAELELEAVGPPSPLEKKASIPLPKSDYKPSRVFTAGGASDMPMAELELEVVGPPSPLERKASIPLLKSGYKPSRVFTAGGASDTSMATLDLELGKISNSAPNQEVSIEFVDSHGAVLRESSTAATGGNSWLFEPSPNLDAIPRADFLVQGLKSTISLPVNPQSNYPLNACEVVTVMNAGRPELRAWISRERTVASAMQHMLTSGYILRAAKIADEAAELLCDKYQDPTGALLGALLLQKIGQLKPRESWLRNLARDFDWLNDAKVLLALLLSREETQQDEALSLALKASTRPMMFTESYSLLLDLLRRWPWPGSQDERGLALESLTMMAPYTNWDSMMFYQTAPVEEPHADTDHVTRPPG